MKIPNQNPIKQQQNPDEFDEESALWLVNHQPGPAWISRTGIHVPDVWTVDVELPTVWQGTKKDVDSQAGRLQGGPPPSYRLVYNSNNYRYNSHKS